MLKICNLAVAFGTRGVLKNMSAVVGKEDMVTIVGENGAGKSTLFSAISGTVPITSGSIFLDGQDITHLPTYKRCRHISRLFQNPSDNCVLDMSVKENITLAFLKNKTPTITHSIQSRFPQEHIERVCQELSFDLYPLLPLPMKALSGGQRQFVSFIMATLLPPKLLLLDEPTAALDPSSATSLLLGVQKFIKRHPIATLLITHDPEIARSMGNKTWVIKEGAIETMHEGKEKFSRATSLIGDIDYSLLKKHNDFI